METTTSAGLLTLKVFVDNKTFMHILESDGNAYGLLGRMIQQKCLAGIGSRILTITLELNHLD